MKKIEAFVQPFMIHKVKDALRAIHIHGMSVSEIKGFGREKDESYPHHVIDAIVDFTPKTKIEIFCPDKDCKQISEIIQKNAHTGRKGDGKIFIYNVEEAISILSGAKGDEAI